MPKGQGAVAIQNLPGCVLETLTLAYRADANDCSSLKQRFLARDRGRYQLQDYLQPVNDAGHPWTITTGAHGLPGWKPGGFQEIKAMDKLGAPMVYPWFDLDEATTMNPYDGTWRVFSSLFWNYQETDASGRVTFEFDQLPVESIGDTVKQIFGTDLASLEDFRLFAAPPWLGLFFSYSRAKLFISYIHGPVVLVREFKNPSCTQAGNW